MNKKLLAAAIAAAAALPMGAQAGVQIYGVIHASIDYVDVDHSPYDYYYEYDNHNDSFWDVTSDTSRIGLKGSEDLGNGLKAIWKVEQGVNIAEGGGQWATRNAYIGLAGDWGTFLYGRHDTPLKISTGSLDLFADRTADYNFNCDGSAYCGGLMDRRAADAIAYISPNMNGLTFAAAIIPGWDTSGMHEDGLADGYSLAVMYSNNGLYLSAAYEDVSDLVDPDDLFDSDDHLDNTVWRLGIGYDINNFHIGLIYENESNDYKAHSIYDEDYDTDADKWQISASYTFGNNVIKAMYYDISTDTDVSYGYHYYDDWGYSGDGDAWAIGFDHNLSKRTTAYALYTDADFADHDLDASGSVHNYSEAVEGSSFGVGLIHKF